MSNGSPVVLEQVPPEGGQALRVELADKLTPNQGVDLGGEHRLSITRPPGSDEPTMQVLGGEELPIVLSGELRDTYFAEPGGAAEVSNKLDRMRREGVPVRLTWGSTWDRLCIVESFTATVLRADFIRWSMRLQVLRRDDMEDAVKPVDGQRGGADVTRAAERLDLSTREQRARQVSAWPVE